MRSRPRFVAALVVVLLSAVVAAGGACSRAPRESAAQAREPAVVIFTNESSYEAAVFMVSSTGRQLRLGTVQPGQKDTLRVASSAIPPGGGMAIVARLRALNRVLSTGPFTLTAGEGVAVQLPLDARMLNLLPAR